MALTDSNTMALPEVLDALAEKYREQRMESMQHIPENTMAHKAVFELDEVLQGENCALAFLFDDAGEYQVGLESLGEPPS